MERGQVVLESKSWQDVLRAINAPVILFGLVLLVVLTATVLIVTTGGLDSSERLWVASERLWVAIGGAILIQTVLAMVFALCWFRPTNLMFTAEAHLEQYRLEHQVELIARDRFSAEPMILPASELISTEPTVLPAYDDTEVQQEPVHLEQYRLENQVELIARDRFSAEPTILPVNNDTETEQEPG